MEVYKNCGFVAGKRVGEGYPVWGNALDGNSRGILNPPKIKGEKIMWPIRHGGKHPGWRGGKIVNNQGYVYVLSPYHPHKNRCNRVAEHRLVMETFLGRYLLPSEDVHHINGNKLDNRIENLQLFTHSEHRRFEIKKGHPDRWAADWDKCVICGTTRNKHNAYGYCKQCYNRALLNNVLVREV